MPEYGVWNSMKQRCHNPNHTGYYKYGARGIYVCLDWWGSFEKFYRDMGPRPSPQHSIERIDNNGPYALHNCRWATKKEQSSNVRTNHRLTHNGQTLMISEWVNVTGLNKSTIYRRLKRGLSVEAVLAV